MTERINQQQSHVLESIVLEKKEKGWHCNWGWIIYGSKQTCGYN